jgi:non-ribosomal peptide synthetase component F
MLSLFYVLLFRWTGQNDICLGVASANRNHPDLEGSIGFFVNLLPVRCRVFEDIDFDELVSTVAERMQDALDHREYPFDLMVEKLNPVRKSSLQPLVNVIYGFQNFTEVHVSVGDHQERSPQASTEPVPDWSTFNVSFKTSKFDLTLFVTEELDNLVLTFEYDVSLFDSATIAELAAQMTSFADALARRPSSGGRIDSVSDTATTNNELLLERVL